MLRAGDRAAVQRAVLRNPSDQLLLCLHNCFRTTAVRLDFQRLSRLTSGFYISTISRSVAFAYLVRFNIPNLLQSIVLIGILLFLSMLPPISKSFSCKIRPVF